MDWAQVKQDASTSLEERGLGPEYQKRLKTEIIEIEKQGANRIWAEYHEKAEKWDKNPNGLVLPWLLDMTPVDPIKDKINHKWTYQPDFPDIDLDFLPIARQTIKNYAAKKYINVCSVGNWNTYKPKSALQDACRALGGDFREVLIITKQLPDEFDDLTLADHDEFFKKLESDDPAVRQEAHMEISRYQAFYDYRTANTKVVDVAYRMVGKIKSQGTHAGGIIIADRPVNDLIPLSLMRTADGDRNWTSQWTEGDKPQLSKFGLVKYDALGLKTMQYIWQTAVIVNQTRGIDMSPVKGRFIDWSDMDPLADPPRIGYERMSDGTKKVILLNDPEALKMCNDLRTDSVFQIETDIQKGIISDGGVKSFWDLVVYNALGRPGPMDMIPEYIKRRDDKDQNWRKNIDERITKILAPTYNVIVYQEQLTAIWMAIAGFTVPEAEAARKVIAKKWAEKLPKVEQQWKQGATKSIGAKEADEWWEKMVTFGRYAFNLAHSVAYSLITYMCLYLKAHYPTEWWAAVMTLCHPDKLANYMSAARIEGVEFGLLNANALNTNHSVQNGKVILGLSSIKGIGEKAAEQFTQVKGPFKNIDEMVEKCGKSKTVLERLIKLGAFDSIHSNRRGLWTWYLYKYCSGKDVTALKEEIRQKLMPSDAEIEAERQRQADKFKSLYPKRKIPKKILNYKPKIDPTRDQVMALYEDFSQTQKLADEKEFLGYYWTSPLTLYQHSGNTIERAKISGVMEIVVEELIEKTSKRGNIYYQLRVTDGIQSTPITVWQNVVQGSDKRCFSQGVGLRVFVIYNEERNNFRIANDTFVIPLLKVGESDDKKDDVTTEVVTEEPIALW